MGYLTYEQKQVLLEMIYYQIMDWYPNAIPLKMYVIARERANYCLEALGEKLD